MKYKAGQRVRIEWPNGAIHEDLLKEVDGTSPLLRTAVLGLSLYSNYDGRTVTILAEPRPEEPTGLGAVAEATFASRRCKCLHAGDGVWIVLHEDAREPGGLWTSRAAWGHLTDPVVLSEGWNGG